MAQKPKLPCSSKYLNRKGELNQQENSIKIHSHQDKYTLHLISFSGTTVYEQNLILAYYAASKQNSRQRWLA